MPNAAVLEQKQKQEETEVQMLEAQYKSLDEAVKKYAKEAGKLDYVSS